MRQEGISGLAFDQRDDHASVTLADEGIAFPIAHTAPAINNARAILDRDLVGDAATTGVATIALAPLLATAQITVELTTVTLVGVDKLVNPFMADTDPLLIRETRYTLLACARRVYRVLRSTSETTTPR